MSSRTNMISNDISRAVLDYISQNENDKVPTKNIAKVGQALSLIRDLLENHAKVEQSEQLALTVDYGETDVTITMTLPLDWTFDKKALKVCKSLLGLVDAMSHSCGEVDADGVPIDDNLSFTIRKVFEPKAD